MVVSAIETVNILPKKDWRYTMKRLEDVEMKNRYFEAWKNLVGNEMSAVRSRPALVKQFSWAIPNDAAIDEIEKVGKVVEAGAGSGYWARLLRDRGVDLVAYDQNPPIVSTNQYASHQYTDVLVGGPEALKPHGDRALFLCWPTYDTPFAADCLAHWAGNILIYVGEGPGGCCADDRFFEILDSDFSCIKNVDIPRWFGMNDYMSIWRRVL
jgi:hypothetical protein